MLCANLIEKQSELRDISSIALKSVFAELLVSAHSQVSGVILRVIPKLLRTLGMSSNVLLKIFFNDRSRKYLLNNGGRMNL